MNDKVNYGDSATIAQALKFQIRSGKSWEDLTSAAKESLDQIATAIARTVAGDGAHWDGIIGFAQAARPATDEPITVELERGIRDFVRTTIPARNDHG